MEKMLTSFQIKNFRLFHELSIDLLNRINLIVGKNNSGKSALLEAVQLYVSNGSTGHVLFNLVTNRDETWKGQLQSAELPVDSNPIRHLFYGHKIPRLGEPGIVLGPIGPRSNQLQVFSAAYRVEKGEDDISRRILLSADEVPTDLSELEIALVAKEHRKLRRVFRLDRDFDDEGRFQRRSEVLGRSDSKLPLEVLPTRNIAEDRIATLWDQINLSGLDEEVIQGLRLLDPTISGVAFVESSPRKYRSARTPIVKLSSMSEPLSLRTLGDGMTRIFQIIVALVNAQNGVLLIDEFENGLHWSVQPKVWDMVFRLASNLNVQVFATTHSRDCIDGYQRVWKAHEELGAFFRLNARPDGEITVTSYSCETLSDALETDVEVR